MSTDQMILCLEQKVILLTRILDLTKQMEVRCSEEDINLDDLLPPRGEYMQRLVKCNNLIVNLTQQLPPDEQERMQQILHAKLSEEDCTEEEKTILLLSKNCISLTERTMALDRVANQALRKQCDALREKINDSRKNGKNQTLFENFIN